MNRALEIIWNTFKTIETYILRTFYLDYVASVWNPYFKKDTELIEGVERRASMLVKELKNLSYEERLVKLSLTTLEERGLRGNLEQVHKIIHEIYNINLIKCL